MARKMLLVIDSNSVIHRAFHALPPLTTKKGEQVGAVFGFLLVFFKAIKDFQPDFVAACFDFPGPTFRHEKFKLYKAKRPPVPQELRQQMPKVKEILKSFKVPVFEKEGFEADDLIGTIAKLARKKQAFPEMKTIIVSGDKDVLQLVDKNTRAYSLNKGVKATILYDEDKVKEKYQGITPSQLVDLRALKGDPSDNIPGVPGIGEKTAIGLIKEYGSLENIYDNLTLIKGKTREKLTQHKDSAFFSQELAQINKNVPINFDLKGCQWREYDRVEAKDALENLEFYSLVNRLP